MDMKRILSLLCGLALLAGCMVQIPDDAYVIGFYNVENLFDAEHDRGKSDQAFLPDGENNWTQEKYEKKVANIAEVIKAMADKNGRWHTVLGMAEVENDRVLEALVADPQIAEAGYEFIHFEGPDVRGIDCAMLYRPSQFKVLETRTLPYDFNTRKDIVFEKTPEEQPPSRRATCSSCAACWRARPSPSTCATGLRAREARGATCAAAPRRSSTTTSARWRRSTPASRWW